MKGAFDQVLRLQREASALGFDWPDAQGPLAKIVEEAQEVRSALEQNSLEAAKSELGDLLFSALNLARFLDCDPGEALEAASRRFAQRVQAVRDAVEADGRSLARCSLEELDVYWEQVKRRGGPPPFEG